MASAVIFDFYGTLARWAESRASNYEAVFSGHGYVLPQAVLAEYVARYDGVAHHEHSVSEEAYERWVRLRLRDLTDACEVEPAHADDVIESLRAADQGTMVAYPEAAETLRRLRGAGLAVGVCSNWGWELDACLRQVGLLHLLDVALTSAQVGARKPHPDIYARSAAALRVDPGDVIFVGDSWEPDVRGPQRSGMTAVHVWREDDRAGEDPPQLGPGDHRVQDLTGVLDLLEVS
jgi:putative hydrolase of the HAD superfamily